MADPLAPPGAERTVTLHKGASRAGFGLVVMGGEPRPAVAGKSAPGVTPVLVAQLRAGSPAAAAGTVHPGDLILAVNGVATADLTHDRVVLLLKTSTAELTLTLRAAAPTAATAAAAAALALQQQQQQQQQQAGHAAAAPLAHPDIIAHVRGLVQASSRPPLFC